MDDHTLSRRNVLRKSAAYGIGTVGAVGLPVVGRAKGATQENSPQATDPVELFRLIDNGIERGSTSIRVRREDTDAVVDEFELETVGTNNPAVNDLPHDERFPRVAADIRSFGRLAPGRYSLDVSRGELSDSVTFAVRNGRLVGGDVFVARILPGDRLDVGSRHTDDPL